MVDKSSLIAGNASMQTFSKNGLHLNSEPISEYILFEIPTVANNTTRSIARLADKSLTIKLVSVFFTPSVNNSIFSILIREGTTIIYQATFSTAATFHSIPTMIARPYQELAILTPAGLSLTNVLLVSQEIFIADVIK